MLAIVIIIGVVHHYCCLAFREMRECFSQLSKDGDCRAVVLSAAGKIYSAGSNRLQTAVLCSLVFFI